MLRAVHVSAEHGPTAVSCDRDTCFGHGDPIEDMADTAVAALAASL